MMTSDYTKLDISRLIHTTARHHTQRGGYNALQSANVCKAIFSTSLLSHILITRPPRKITFAVESDLCFRLERKVEKAAGQDRCVAGPNSRNFYVRGPNNPN